MRLPRLLPARLRRDARGLSALEFGLLAPVFLFIIIGVGQMGILFEAQAGLRHAVAEGARSATVFVAANTPQRPTNAQIISTINGSKYGLNASYITGPTITSGTSDGATYLDITMSYAVPLDFIFYRPPAITLTETRRVYVQS